jgi:hypothetical protein
MRQIYACTLCGCRGHVLIKSEDQGAGRRYRCTDRHACSLRRAVEQVEHRISVSDSVA